MLGFLLGFATCYFAAGSVVAIRSIGVARQYLGTYGLAFAAFAFLAWPFALFEVDV